MVKTYALGAFGVIAIALLASSYADGYADKASERKVRVEEKSASTLPSEWASDGSEDAGAGEAIAADVEVVVREDWETAH